MPIEAYLASMRRKPTLGGAFRVTVGRVGRSVVAAEPFEPILVIGPPRSRRTSGLVVPALLEWPGPAVCTSVGESLFRQIYPARGEIGEAFTFNAVMEYTEGPTQVGWNPLDRARTYDGAQAVADLLLSTAPPAAGGSSLLRANAVPLLATHLFAAAANGYTIADVTRWVMTMEEFEVRSLLQATGVDIAINAAEAAWQREDRVRHNVYAALQPVMTLWELPLVIGQTQRQPQLSRAAFLDGRPNTFAVSTPADVEYRYRPLTTQVTHTMVQEVVEHNAGFADRALGTDGPVGALLQSQGAVEPLLVALDDADAIAPLPDLLDLAATAAKAAVQLITVFTDVSQMRAIYGQDTARAIVNTHPALVVLPGGHDPATAEIVDRMVGDEPILGLTGSGAASERVRRLPWGTALFVSTNRPATVVALRSSVVDRDLLRHRGERPTVLGRVNKLVHGSARRRRP